MKHTCAKCGNVSEVKNPALVVSGKAMASKITLAQRKAWGAKGGAAKRKKKYGKTI